MILKNDGIAIVGGGGHAKVIISTILEAGMQVYAVVDDDEKKWGKEILGIPIAGPLEMIIRKGIKKAVIAIGDNSVRKEIAKRLNSYCEWITVIHPYSYVHPTVKLGEGTVVFAGAVIQPETEIGRHTIINTGATIDHDCKIGDYVHIAPGVHLAGNVSIGEGTFIGIGSSVINNVTIGNWVILGAGGVVIKDIPAFSKMAGAPAKPIR
ncbi:MAG: acetyltransferase [Tepidanaerobacteraceae bacterium]|jgi:sugar O-acyltransferase (sialic acid O-acetyltransferase NeuD family)|nr:acetyltransferase [Tepidanaerobacteraceae bacterium]